MDAFENYLNCPGEANVWGAHERCIGWDMKQCIGVRLHLQVQHALEVLDFVGYHVGWAHYSSWGHLMIMLIVPLYLCMEASMWGARSLLIKFIANRMN